MAAVLRLADFRRDHWSADDALWEELQLAAIERLVAGERTDPAVLLTRAAALAERSFASNDPRLAASLTNLGRWRRDDGDDRAAAELFQRAILLWREAEAWLVRTAVGDDTLSPTQCRRLVADAERHAVALASRRPILFPCGLGRWRARGTPGRPDRRKLLAAVFLSTFRSPGPLPV